MVKFGDLFRFGAVLYKEHTTMRDKMFDSQHIHGVRNYINSLEMRGEKEMSVGVALNERIDDPHGLRNNNPLAWWGERPVLYALGELYHATATYTEYDNHFESPAKELVHTLLADTRGRYPERHRLNLVFGMVADMPLDEFHRMVVLLNKQEYRSLVCPDTVGQFWMGRMVLAAQYYIQSQQVLGCGDEEGTQC